MKRLPLGDQRNYVYMHCHQILAAQITDRVVMESSDENCEALKRHSLWLTPNMYGLLTILIPHQQAQVSSHVWFNCRSLSFEMPHKSSTRSYRREIMRSYLSMSDKSINRCTPTPSRNSSRMYNETSAENMPETSCSTIGDK